VNGWEEHYSERSFIWQCRNRFGDDLGYRLWESCNSVFDRLPLAAVIDQDIFCVHGGIPRPVSATTTRIQDILSVSKIASVNPPYEHEAEEYQRVASDCIWSDPASEEQEMTSVNPTTGFGESLRGGESLQFCNFAVVDVSFSLVLTVHFFIP
jgi:diadenosine tetraphosphatase ApaH/serine/threonine PP2A family protein phosphatase